MQKYTIGIDAGGTKVAYGLFTMDGVLKYRYQHKTDAKMDGPTFADKLIKKIHKILRENDLTIENLSGVGICMPSFILFDEGYVCMTSAMPKIRDFNMRDYLTERLNVKVVLDNDSNVAALAEHRYGAGRGHKHMVYIAASTGIGSGIIINNDVFRGSYGWAGECGHMIATPGKGASCGCRNKGCYMSYASGKYASKYVKKKIKAGVESSLSKHKKINGKRILDAYHDGDDLAIETVERMAKYFAVCVFNVYQMLNINIFVFGGGLTNFGDVLFGRIREHFDEYLHIKQPVEFRFAELKKDFGIIGASELVRD